MMTNYEQTPAGRGRIGSLVGWGIFVALFAVMAIFGYRVWHYANKIRRGEIVALPQFSQNLTSFGGGLNLAGLAVDRNIIESGARPDLGQTDQPKLTIVMFSDFDCEYSREASNVVRRVMAKYGDRVRLVYRHYPLTDLHPHALEAAVAAECAFEQGKFWPYFDQLYLTQSSRQSADLLRISKEIGMNDEQFERCFAENRYSETVAYDLALAKSLALRGTPTYFFNGIRVEGHIPEDSFVFIIEQMLK